MARLSLFADLMDVCLFASETEMTGDETANSGYELLFSSRFMLPIGF